MILLLTNKQDITADLVVLELQRRGADYLRFNTEEFPQNVQISLDYQNRLSGFFYFINRKHKLSFADIESVWYRRPTLPSPDKRIPEKFMPFSIRESFELLNGVWNNLNCYWLSNPHKIRLAECKITQLGVAQQLGFVVPPTMISNNPADIEDFYEKCNKNIVVKPIKMGLVGDGVVVFTNKITPAAFENIESAALVPAIYQANISKKYDIRITIVGDKVFPIEIHSQTFEDASIDWRHSQHVNIPHKVHSLPESLAKRCLKLVKVLGLEFGAIDMILTPDGDYYFLEINPNGQWAWIEKRTGLRIAEAITDLLCQESHADRKNRFENALI